MTGNKCKSISAAVATYRPRRSLKELAALATSTKTPLFIALAALAFASAKPSHAENFHAEVFDSNHKGPIFTLQLTESTTGPSQQSEAVYKTPDGKIAVHEHLLLENGRLKKYTTEHPLIHQSGTIEVAGNKLLFSYTADGKTKTDHDDFKENTIVPATTLDFIHSHWDQLMKGDFVDARFASAERRETIGFEFFKNGAESIDGHTAVMIRMKPSSMFISAFVKQMTFIFDQSSKQLLEFHGRIIPKQGTKDVDGIIVYHYDAAVPLPANAASH